jgi:uncharacterized protein (DUF2267 family)
MDEAQFVSAVQHTAFIPTQSHTVRAVQATLRVLRRRLGDGAATTLAARLPAAFRADLPETGGGERFGIEEFYERVAGCEPDGTTPQQARRHARAVIAALRASVPPEEFQAIVAELPPEYDDLFQTGSVSH